MTAHGSLSDLTVLFDDEEQEHYDVGEPVTYNHIEIQGGTVISEDRLMHQDWKSHEKRFWNWYLP